MEQIATPTADEVLKPMNGPVIAALVDNHREFLRFLVRRVGDTHTAEDILQQVYERAMRKGAGVRKTESAVAWLYRLVRTTLVDHYRREQSRQRLENEYWQTETLLGDEPDAETQQALCACFETLLPTLKEEYADVLRLVDLGGKPPREAARELGIDANNVRVRLHRARQALRRSLLLSCRTCAEHGCLDCTCGESKPGDGPSETAAGPAS